MSKQSPRDGRVPTNEPATSRGAGLRALPGFKTAAVAFVLTVLLGGGGMAWANWSQSATATMDITAGAAAPPAPAPNIVANPAIAARPTISAPTCNFNGSSEHFSANWTVDPRSTDSDARLTTTNGSQTLQSQVGAATSFSYVFDSSHQGDYMLRIQPISANIAGDPLYLQVHSEKHKDTCSAATSGNVSPLLSPLGAFDFSTAAANPNVLKLSWDKAASATSYLVSIKANASIYGAEFTTGLFGTELVFPTSAHQPSPPYGVYTLRIIPMNSTGTPARAGDPRYLTVNYDKSTGLAVSNYRSTP